MKRKFRSNKTNRVYLAIQAGHGGILTSIYKEFKDGDWIVTNDRGEDRVIPDDEFTKTYVPLDEIAVTKKQQLTWDDAWKNPDAFYQQFTKEKKKSK